MNKWGPVIAIVVVAGCSSSAKSTTTKPTTTTTTIATTTTVAGPTVKQLASIIAGERGGIIEKADSVADGCVIDCTAIAALDAQTMGLRSLTLEIKLKAALAAGPAPGEISVLVDETITQLHDTYNKGDAIRACGATCGPLAVEAVHGSAQDVKSRLAAWAPYIGA